MDLFRDVGEFFQTHNTYLQDPENCDWNVPYRNPHRLSSAETDGPCIWTADLSKYREQLAEIKSIAQRPELLDALSSTNDVPEAPQPKGIRTPLAR